MSERKFSKRCGNCRQQTMALATISYDIQFDHDGRKVNVHVPNLYVPKCENCGAVSIDAEAEEAIDRAFRQQANLLTPEEIRERRQTLGYNQQEFADALGVAVAIISRWETGMQIQQRYHNDLIQALVDVPEFRQYMEKKHDFRRRQAQPVV